MNKFNLKYVITHLFQMTRWDWMNTPLVTKIELCSIGIGLFLLIGIIGVLIYTLIGSNNKRRK